MKLEGIRDVVGDVKAKASNLPGDAVSEKVTLYKDNFDKIGSILNKEQNIGTKDTSYKQYFPLNQSWVRASIALNEAEDSGDTSTNKLSSIYENYFNELGKQLEKFGVSVSGAAIGGAIGQTVLPPNFQEISIDDLLAEAEADERAKNGKLPSKSVETQISILGNTPNNFQEISIDNVLAESNSEPNKTDDNLSSGDSKTAANIREVTITTSSENISSRASMPSGSPATLTPTFKESSSLSYDFGDGKGSVFSHRHKNSDRTEGGWVADTATVDKDVYIGKDAQVSGNAQVLKGSRIMHNAKVSGNAVISETGLYNDSQVYGNAVLTKSTLRGNAKVYDEAEVANSIICGETSIYTKREVVNGRFFNGRELTKEKLNNITLKLFDAVSYHNNNIGGIKKYLLLGADINARDPYGGWTPLHRAAWYGRVETIRILAELGADVNAKISNDQTPLDLAKHNEQKKAIKLLKELSGKTTKKFIFF